MNSKIAIASMVLAGIVTIGCDSKANDEMNKAKEPQRGATTMPSSTDVKSTMSGMGDKASSMGDKAKQEMKDVTNKAGDKMKDMANGMQTTQPAGQP